MREEREREREGGGFGGFPGGLASCNELGMEKAKQQHVYSSLFCERRSEGSDPCLGALWVSSQAVVFALSWMDGGRGVRA